MVDKTSSEIARTSHSSSSRRLNRQVSIKDIARIARVSHPTVSRALQGSPLVHPKTAERIRKIAQEAGYRASAVARGLVTRKTMTIGVVVTTVTDPFASEVVSGIEEAANEHGYSVFLADSNTDPEREKRVVQDFAERRVDGILVQSSRVGALYLTLLREMNVPIVLVNDQYPGEFVHSVMIANEQGMRAAVGHLIELGHRRIAYVGDRNGFQSDTERFAGYRATLEKAGIPVALELVVHGNGRPDGAIEPVKKLMGLNQPPTAICCYNDMTALAAMRIINSLGLHVPADVSVTGFDDLFFAPYTNPPLTSVHQPMRNMGRMAMESLIKLMAGEKSVAQIRIDAKLVRRGSTAAPASRRKKS